MKHSILKSYRRQSDSELVTTGFRILEKMDNNPGFPTPPASFELLKTLMPEFQSAVVKAKSRDRESISVKNDRKVKVLEYLNELNNYVTTVCNGDRTMLLGSGFPVTGEKASPPPPFYENLEVELGQPGEATTRVKKIAGVKVFQHQYTAELPTDSTVWNSELTVTPEHTFSGLVSSGKYWFRIISVHSSGVKIVSPIVQRIIQ